MKLATRAMMVAAAFHVVCGAASGVTLDVETELDLSFVSSHIWRGLEINDEPCFQPSLTMASSNFSFSAWGTWDITDVPDSSSHSRVDLTLEGSAGSGIHLLCAGLAAYIYHDAPSSSKDDTFEVYVRYVADVLLLPSLEVRYDFSSFDGYYASASLAHSFSLKKRTDEVAGVDLDFKIAVSACDEAYANGYYGLPANESAGLSEFKPHKAILSDFTASVWLPMSLSENISVTPMARFVSVIDSDVRDAWSERGMDTDHWLWGASVAFSF